MADDELDIEESDTDLVGTYRRHIEEIFAVEIRGLFENSDTSETETTRLTSTAESTTESVVQQVTAGHDGVCSSNSGNDDDDGGGGISAISTKSIKVTALTKDDVGRENVEKAKAYILSLTVQEPARCDASLQQLPQEALTTLLDQRDEIERQSQAVMEVQLDGQAVHVWGHRVNVAMARSLLDHNLQHITQHDIKTGAADLNAETSPRDQGQDVQDVQDRQLQQDSLTVQVPVVQQSRDLGSQDTSLRVKEDSNTCSLTLALSPNAESNNDSCYNSDASPCGSRRNSSQHGGGDPHSDVSRTTSDTLAAELQDDPPLQLCRSASKTAIDMDSSHGNPAEQAGAVRRDADVCAEAERDSPSVDSTSSSASTGGSSSSGASSSLEELVASNPEYASKVEFALKLGYSEEQLQAALQKLGSDVNQNELLSELINLGSTGATGDSDDSDSDDYDLDLPCPPAEPLEHWPLHVETPPVEKVEPPGGSEDSICSNLRPIVIDGSNVAMSHGNKELFSCQGIKLAVDWFQQRGHLEITVFVPQWRKETSRPDTPIKDQDVLYELERGKVLVFTPARRVGGRRVVCYDDRYIIKLAAQNGGIVVSNDNYRDLMTESPEFKKVIEERLLMYSFVNDRFMPPDDPLGRHGPSLDNFLSLEPMVPELLPPVCPYGKKCTYGNKCKYYHPERGTQPHKSVTQKLAEQAKIKLKDFKQREQLGHSLSTGATKLRRPSPDGRKAALTKTKSLNPVSRNPLGRTKSLSPALPIRQFDHSDLFNSSLASPSVPTLPVTSEVDRGGRTEANPDPPVSISLNSGEVMNHNNFKYREYNDRLAECREKMDQAEAVERHKHRTLATRGQQQQAAMTQNNQAGHLNAQLDQSVASLKPPDHWSLGHPQLQPTHSEPSLRYNERGGHLALAKKLSDEGTNSDGQPPLMREISKSFGELAAPSPSLSPPRQMPHHVIYQQDGQNGQNLHRKLNRQLSLKGSEDPRLRQQGVKQHSILKHSNSEGPARMALGHQTAKWRIGGQPKAEVADWYQSGHQAEERFINAAAPARHRDLRQCVSYNRQQPVVNTDLLHPGMGHNQVTRMASAPVAANESSNRGVPLMNRQNSTSEPHLFTYQNSPRVYQEEQQQLPQVPQSPWNNEVTFQLDTNMADPVTPDHRPVDFSTTEYNHQPLYNRSSVPNMMSQQPNAFAMSVHAAPFSPKHSNPPTPSRIPLELNEPRTVMSSPDMTQLYDPRTVQRPPPGHPGHQQYPDPNMTRTDHMGGHQDPRHSIYFHLRGLFPDDKVRWVMMQHPEETNPQNLCAYLLSMN